MRFLLLCILVILRIVGLAQPNDRFTSCLRGHHYSDFILFIEDTINLNPIIKYEEKQSVTMLNGLNLLELQVMVLIKDTTFYNYKLVRKGDTIFQYSILKHESGDVDSIVNTIADSTLHQFRSIKQKPDELYSDFFIYAVTCGDTPGAPPDYRKKFNRLKWTEQAQTFEQWLLSSYPELQLYAVEGFHDLYKKGYKLSNKQGAIINFIKNSNAMAWTCGGCIIFQETCKELATNFKFE